MANVSSSNSQKANVPKLRFPEFTEEWKTERLSDFVERVTRKNVNNQTELPLTISSKDGLVDQITYFNKKVSSKDMSDYYLLKNGEFAYNKSYSVGYDFGSIKRLDKYPMGALSTLYICFKPIKYQSDFLKIYFDSLKWYKEIYIIAAEGARNHGLLNVPTEDFFDTRHILPTNEKEQSKIADFLTFLEQRIEKQRQLVEALKSYKRGLITKLYSQNSNNWKAYTFDELGIFYNGLTGKSKDDFGCGNDCFIPYMNVYKNTIANTNILEKVHIEDAEKQKKVSYGDILFTQSSETLEEVGLTSVWLNDTNPYLNSFCFGFRFNSLKNINPIFIAYLMRSDMVRFQIMREGQGATRVNLSSERLKSLSIRIPEKATQDEISKIIHSIDKLIFYNDYIKTHFFKMKEGLLQQMFI